MTPTLAAFAALQLGDVLSTAAALSRGAREANPVAAAVLDAGGVPLLALAKVGVVLAATLVVLLMPPRGLGKARFTLQLANVAMAFVVLSNLGLAMNLSD